MASPVDDSYAAPSAGVIAGGRYRAPSWIRNAPIGAWTTVAGTTAPVYLNDYSGLAWREDSTLVECASLCSGGHGGNLTANEVLTLRIDVDSPVWVSRTENSDATGWNTTGSTGPHFPSDGRPVPRHSYWYNWWVPELNRYMMFGCRFAGSLAYDYLTVDGFDPLYDDWDAPSTFANLTVGYQPTLRDPDSGLLYGTGNGLVTFNPTTQQWLQQSMTGTGTVNRGGSAFDTLRGQIYHLSTGNNFSEGGSVASTVISTSGVKTPISFNASAAWARFQSRAVVFLCSMLVYDPDLDRFYFYNGETGGTADIYVITPNAGTTWDMALLAVTGVTPPVASAGVMTKFRYISRLKACVLVVGGQLVHFVRTQ